MTAEDFVLNASTGYWEATTTVASLFDVHVELKKEDQLKKKSVGILWKGNASDPNYIPVENGTCIGRLAMQVKSEFYPVLIKIQCEAKPEYARLTTH